ncbi:hypothetical protein C7999DRAFT_32318 [Corynascus novoguineensis]|uniref:Uncharacterized protein n=1 Tax=Corynascus novoguineensis TaxID=1126955 RepID=A0AAN7HN91_9PEZI|nr:hypothetical protein C7999DRAFT_32318 [Corynascus novoguineensis]
MKYTTIITTVALLLTGAMALPNPKANPEPEANPQICVCGGGPGNCYDSCGQPFCC